MSLSLFSLKNSSWLSHTTSSDARGDGRAETPSRQTSQKTIALSLVVGVALHPRTLPWASMRTADSPIEAGSPALWQESRAGDISGTVGSLELPPPWSTWRVRGHELVGRCGRPWTPNPEIINSQSFQSSHPTSLRKPRHLRKAVWIVEAF